MDNPKIPARLFPKDLVVLPELQPIDNMLKDKKSLYTTIPNYPYLLSPLQKYGDLLNKEKDLSKEEFEKLLKEANEYNKNKKIRKS